MPALQSKYHHLAFASLALTALALGLGNLAARGEPDWRFEIKPVHATGGGAPYFETVLDYVVTDGVAHSPAIALDGPVTRLIWFQGSKEAGSDVKIMSTALTVNGDRWTASQPTPIFDSSMVASHTTPRQAVRKLGNTIDAGQGHYYATTVAVGGWSMASIAHVLIQEGKVDQARRLTLSPFLNRSHLVRSPIVRFVDGDIALPAYLEFGNAFGEFIRIGPDGRVRDKSRMGSGRIAIQPMVVPLDAHRAVAFLRNFDGKRVLYLSRTDNGGKNWSAPAAVNGAPNPNAPVAVIKLSNGSLLMAFNDSEKRADLLKLGLSEDEGRSWRRIATLEDHAGDYTRAARYPMMRRLLSGRILLVYSSNAKHGVRAHVFNEAWILAQ